ncbi:MAG: hypothetical protein RLP12_06230 [Ekhidna sp.]
MKSVGADSWDMFCGTPGFQRNIVIALMRENRIAAYLKTSVKQRTTTEYKLYEYIRSLDLKYSGIPNFQKFESSILLSPVIGKQFNNRHKNTLLKCLSELASKTISSITLDSYFDCINVFERLTIFFEDSPLDSRVGESVFQNIAIEIDKKISNLDRSMVIKTCYSLVDFTPWNSLVKDNIMYLIDLEYACPDISLGYDLVHFFSQPWLMLKDVKNNGGYSGLLSRKVSDLLIRTYGLNRSESNLYIDLYILQNSLRVMELYLKQPVLHKQGIAQLRLWQNINEIWLLD